MVRVGQQYGISGSVGYVDACDDMETEITLKDEKSGESITLSLDIEKAVYFMRLIKAAVDMAKAIKAVRE